MIRFASQLVFCSPQQILRRTVIEQNEKNTITRIFGLDESLAESAQTSFFNGIISSEFISLKQNLNEAILAKLCADYQYIDLSDELILKPVISLNKPLILDFGLNNIDQINKKIDVLLSVLTGFSITDIIAACTYFPAIVSGKASTIQVNNTTQLVLWENINFRTYQFNENTSVKFLI